MNRLALVIESKIGGPYHVVVDRADTIRDVMDAIWSIYDIRPEQQKLVFGGAPLEPSDTLAKHNITEGSTIVLTYVAKSTEELKTLGDEVMVCLADYGGREEVLTISPHASVLDLKSAWKKAATEGCPCASIELSCNNMIMVDAAPLTQYKVGHNCMTYIFIAYRVEALAEGKGCRSELPSRVLPTLKDLSLHSKDSYTVKISADNDHRYLLVLSAEVTIVQLKEAFLAFRRGRMQVLAKQATKKNKSKEDYQEWGISDFVFLQKGKAMVDESTKAADFALKNGEIVLQVSTSPTHDPLRLVMQTFQEASSSDAFKKQVQLAKAYHTDRSVLGKSRLALFHDIKSINREQVPDDVKKATQFTADLLKTKPSGNLDDGERTVAHIISNLFHQNDDQVLFFDSRKGLKLQDSMSTIDDMFLLNKPMVLRLNDLSGLGGRDWLAGNTKEQQYHTMGSMQAAIETDTAHPILEDITIRLARSLGVNQGRIRLTEVFEGSVCVQYTVAHLSQRERYAIIQQDTTGRLRSEFPGFIELRVHPLLFRPAFDLAIFDTRGNKNFHNGSTFHVGPTGQQRKYTQPQGWVRVGLKVLSGQPTDDKWLHPFNHPENWWRAYHGTANAGRRRFGTNASNTSELQNAALSAVRSIYDDGFHLARVSRLGPGVYCSPNPTWMETERYAATIPVHIQGGSRPKEFRLMLQVAVRPGSDTLQPRSTEDIWAVRKKDWIRPYGILIKEAA